MVSKCVLLLKWATFIFVQTNMSQQTLICLLGQFDKRFSQRSSTILALAHDALTERQGLPSITSFSVFVWQSRQEDTHEPRAIRCQHARAICGTGTWSLRLAHR